MKNNEMKRIEVLKRLFTYTKKYRFKYIIALLCGAIAVILELIGPLMLAEVVDRIADLSINKKNIITFTLIFLGVSVFASQAFLFIERWILVSIGQKIVYEIREEIFLHTLSLSNKEFVSIKTGRLVTRITSDTLTLNEMFTSTLVNMIRDILTSLIAIIIMVVISVKISMYVLLFTPLL